MWFIPKEETSRTEAEALHPIIQNKRISSNESECVCNTDTERCDAPSAGIQLVFSRLPPSCEAVLDVSVQYLHSWTNNRTKSYEEFDLQITLRGRNQSEGHILQPGRQNIRSLSTFLQNHRHLRGWRFFIFQLHVNLGWIFIFCREGLGTKNTREGLRMEMSAERLKKKPAFHATNAEKYLQVSVKISTAATQTAAVPVGVRSLHVLMWKSANKQIIWTWYTAFGANVNLGCIFGLQKR